jgi:glycerol kinase
MPNRALIPAIDQGTTNTKAVLVDPRGTIVAGASRPMDIEYPQPGWVQQDAQAIWTAVRECLDEVLAEAGSPALAGIGISNQRESAVAWERDTGTPVGPAVSWQCRRSTDLCEELRAGGHADDIEARTGLPLDPGFTAGKWRWLLDAAADGRARATTGQILLGTIDSWLLWNLTGGAQHATDFSNASQTQLMDLDSCSWDAGLCELCDVPTAALPQIRPSSGVSGRSAQAHLQRRLRASQCDEPIPHSRCGGGGTRELPRLGRVSARVVPGVRMEVKPGRC